MRKRSMQNSVCERKEGIMTNQLFVQLYGMARGRLKREIICWLGWVCNHGEILSRNKEESRRNFVCVKDFQSWKEPAIPAFTEKTHEGLVVQSPDMGKDGFVPSKVGWKTLILPSCYVKKLWKAVGGSNQVTGIFESVILLRCAMDYRERIPSQGIRIACFNVE